MMAAPMATNNPQSVGGMTGLRGYTISQPEAPPEVVHGGPVDPAHGNWGEQAEPYSWESLLTNYPGHSGPYGPENQMLGDETALYGMDAGTLGKDPQGDLTPYTHAAPMNVTLSGALPSQYDAVNQELVQGAENRGTDLGADRQNELTPQGYAQQDHWAEIWDVSQGDDKYGPNPNWNGYAQFGIGVNDRTSNPLRKTNEYEFDEGHHHRRYATGSVPGNYMWMRPGSRPMRKTVAGPARPATGQDSPFTGDDLGASFGIQGAVLVEVPQEYQPPPSPQIVAPVNDDSPAPPIPLW